MIACPQCHHAHPRHLTAAQCVQCGFSFEELYLCPNHACTYHQAFQWRTRQCQACQRNLIGEYSGRTITWGHAIFRIREYVGGGGMGEVYRGIEQDHSGTYQREVAVKFNKNMMDLDIVKRFQLEVQVLSMLQNPHNIRVYTYGEMYEERATGKEVRAQFMVMELLKGLTLNELLQKGPLPPHQAIPIFVEVCGALAEAHQKDIIHRDLKPHNIMLQNVSGDYFAKVFDFGLSRLTTSMDDRLSTSGVVMGTFRYMSPEQALGEDVDHRTDIFSLGVVLYETLTGRHPFPAKNLFDLFTFHQQGPPPLDELPPELAAIVFKALAYEKAERYATTDDFRQDLQIWNGDSMSGRYSLAQLAASGRVPGAASRLQALSQARHSKSVPSLSSAGAALSQANAAAPVKPAAPAVSPNRMGLLLGLATGATLVMAFLVFLLLPKSGNRGVIGATDEPDTITPNPALTRPRPSPGNLPPAEPRRGSHSPSSPLRASTIPEPRIPSPPPSLRGSEPSARSKGKKRPYRRGKRPPREVENPSRSEPPLPPVDQPQTRIDPPPPRRIDPPLPPPRRVEEPRIIIQRVIERPAEPEPPPCPERGSSITYQQLDPALNDIMTNRVINAINKAASSTVYDAGLRLSQSWRPAKVVCKVDYLCGQIKQWANGYCRKWRPHKHCKGYKAALDSSQSPVQFYCKKS